MRIIRKHQGWWLVRDGFPARDRLEAVAFSVGYRVGEMCAHLAVSQAYLREVFLRDVGLSPKEWMRRERMVAARRLVRRGVLLKVVSEWLGFADINSFRREFRRTHGVSVGRFKDLAGRPGCLPD